MEIESALSHSPKEYQHWKIFLVELFVLLLPFLSGLSLALGILGLILGCDPKYPGGCPLSSTAYGYLQEGTWQFVPEEALVQTSLEYTLGGNVSCLYTQTWNNLQESLSYNITTETWLIVKGSKCYPPDQNDTRTWWIGVSSFIIFGVLFPIFLLLSRKYYLFYKNHYEAWKACQTAADKRFGKVFYVFVDCMIKCYCLPIALFCICFIAFFFLTILAKPLPKSSDGMLISSTCVNNSCQHLYQIDQGINTNNTCTYTTGESSVPYTLFLEIHDRLTCSPYDYTGDHLLIALLVFASIICLLLLLFSFIGCYAYFKTRRSHHSEEPLIS